MFTDHISEGGNAIASVRLSIRLFQLYLRNRLTVDLEHLHVSRPIAYVDSWEKTGGQCQVTVMSEVNAVGPTSIEGSLFLVPLYHVHIADFISVC